MVVHISRISGLLLLCLFISHTAAAEAFVPGGTRVAGAGDDFEDPNWSYNPSLPKSSANIDKVSREPFGRSANGRITESAFRGTPDHIKRVETPAGGIPGSKGALLIRTLNAGVPGQTSAEAQQDDLMVQGANLPLERYPSMTVRVYVPPFDQWEQRQGSSFGVRANVNATKTIPGRGRRSQPKVESDPYWPGFFFQLVPAQVSQSKQAFVSLVIRANEQGQDYAIRTIHQPGWWTLGMSFTPDAKVHYYAHPGSADLRETDLLASHTPYGLRGESVSLMFFNILSWDDGKTWSTPWIVDDPMLFYRR